MDEDYFDRHFQQWINVVNDIVITNIGFSIYDLPDQYYADSFEAGMNEHDMASVVIDDWNNYNNYNINVSIIDTKNCAEP